ncbi:23S rRNA pseudouridylate synthase B, partial [Massilia sp. CT11-108]
MNETIPAEAGQETAAKPKRRTKPKAEAAPAPAPEGAQPEAVEKPKRTRKTAAQKAAEDDAPKLHKVLAEAGLGSRRDMEE